MNTEHEKFKFSVDSALLEELGEKLVSSVHVALTELVKNSYDADATLVHIAIKQDGSSYRIEITDNGSGMTQEDVRRFWMRIGTTNKVDNPVSAKYGRRRTGAKGVGRFACRRLGLHLKLVTTAMRQSDDTNSSIEKRLFETTTIHFDWKTFAPGDGVDSVESDGEVSESRTGSVGTKLEIWGAPSDEWSRLGYHYLQRQLGVLTTNMGASRTGYEEDPGFNVHLDIPIFGGRVLDLRSKILDAGWGTVTAEVDERGHAVCTLVAKGMMTRTLRSSSASFASICGARLAIGVFPSDKSQFRDPSILSKQNAVAITTEFGGVHVKHNGFRVYPYGDPEDDWLRIDADRARRLGKPTDEDLYKFAESLQGVDAARSLLNMLSQRNYIGYVEVTSDIKGLIPRLDRQGFISGDAFEQLKAFARYAIDWANIYRDFYIRSQVEASASSALLAVRKVLNEEVDKEQLVPRVASYLRQEIKKIVQYLPQDSQKSTEQSLLTTLRAIESNNDANVRQLEHLRLIASASTLTLLFAHEVRTLLGTLGATSKRLKMLANKQNDSDKNSLEVLISQIESTRDRMDDLVEMTGIVGAFGKQKEAQSIHLRTAIERAARCFGLLTRMYKINIDSSNIAGDLVVGPIVEGELFTIFINIISNSIKALIAAGSRNKTINISANKDGQKVNIVILDNGIGIAPEYFDEVFKPFVSDPDGNLYDQLGRMANGQDEHIFGTGSGLGLAIVKDIVIARKGEISFKNPPDTWKTSIQLRLPCHNVS